MKTKSVNHLTITARLTTDATVLKEGNVIRFRAVHNVGSQPLYLDAVIFMNLGKKFEKKIDASRLTKGNELILDGSLKPTAWTDKEGQRRSGIDFVVSRISEPELVEDKVPDEEETAPEEGQEA